MVVPISSATPRSSGSRHSTSGAWASGHGAQAASGFTPRYRSVETSLHQRLYGQRPVNRREACQHFREARFTTQDTVLGDLALENADQAAAARAASAAFGAHRFRSRLGSA